MERSWPSRPTEPPGRGSGVRRSPSRPMRPSTSPPDRSGRLRPSPSGTAHFYRDDSARRASLLGQPAIDPVQRLLLAVDDAVELGVANPLEDGGELRPGTEAMAHQVMAGDQGRRVHRAAGLVSEVEFA